MKTHGGKRKGAGRKKLPVSVKRVKVMITMNPELHKKTAGNRSEIIETALKKYYTR